MYITSLYTRPRGLGSLSLPPSRIIPSSVWPSKAPPAADDAHWPSFRAAPRRPKKKHASASADAAVTLKNKLSLSSALLCALLLPAYAAAAQRWRGMQGERESGSLAAAGRTTTTTGRRESPLTTTTTTSPSFHPSPVAVRHSWVEVCNKHIGNPLPCETTQGPAR